jgi:serine/threonine protein kinase
MLFLGKVFEAMMSAPNFSESDRLVYLRNPPAAGVRPEQRYRVLSLIGSGSASAVYHARDILRNRDVVLKILRAGSSLAGVSEKLRG